MPEKWLAESDPTRLPYMGSTVDPLVSSEKYLYLGMPVALMELDKIFVEVNLPCYVLLIKDGC